MNCKKLRWTTISKPKSFSCSWGQMNLRHCTYSPRLHFLIWISELSVWPQVKSFVALHFSSSNEVVEIIFSLNFMKSVSNEKRKIRMHLKGPPSWSKYGPVFSLLSLSLPLALSASYNFGQDNWESCDVTEGGPVKNRRCTPPSSLKTWSFIVDGC